MERVVVGLVLLVVGVVGAGRAWQAFRARGGAVGLRARTLARGGIAGLVLCLAIAELGLALLVDGATGAVAERIPRRVLSVVVVAAVAAVVYAVIAWQEHRRARTAPVDGSARSAASPPAPVPVPPGEPAGWVPPTPQAAALRAARDSGDPDAICTALAMEPLAWRVRVEDIDRALAGPGHATPALGRSHGGRLYLDVWTEGCVPTPAAEEALLCTDVAWYAEVDAPISLVVDEGRPQQTTVDVADVRRWATRRTPRPVDAATHRLRALVPVTDEGPLTHGLACAAHHAVMTGTPWNRLGPRGLDRLATRRSLRDAWGFHGARDWQAALDALAEPWSSGPDTVLHLRRQLGDGAFVPADAVREVVEADVNVERNGRETTDRVLDELRRIEAYEEYLREHDVLARWEQVHTLLAWDLGRGAMLARWGLDADWCDETTARWQVERFGTLARRYFDSWTEFGASYVLGRALWSADQVDHLDWSTLDLADSVRPFTVLTSDPASPWRTVPFHPARPVAALDDAGS
ncbi:DUF1266 domain-containing protein [Actinomycetospora sp. OC33-EN08]|uniref:DUF1266 domain-containing protein n=1 Tax=Actinomycetospora aurantiaca TaxID=3129233 RepID=A0ABU8MMJ6_9PSEU